MDTESRSHEESDRKEHVEDLNLLHGIRHYCKVKRHMIGREKFLKYTYYILLKSALEKQQG